MSANTTTTTTKDIHDWTSEDHSPACLTARKAYMAEAAAARAQNKSIKPFVCKNEPGCCPEDIIVNAGIASVIIGAQAAVPTDSPRMDVGDRRQGAYYARLLGLPGMVGLQRVKMVPIKRLAELEKTRRQRIGLDPADWIVAARKKAAAEQAGNAAPAEETNPLLRAMQG